MTSLNHEQPGFSPDSQESGLESPPLTGWESVAALSGKQLSPQEAIEQDTGNSEENDILTGAKVLSRANFDSRHKKITDSSLEKMRRQGERIPGKNNDRRNYAYLARLDRLIEKYGDKAESRLWTMSIDGLVIDEEDIPESFFEQQEEILRQQGQGHQLRSWEREMLVKDIQKKQEESLQEWADYLGSEESPFPLWFKVYAWDGMSKMGVFDAQKRKYLKRDRTTTAPYPGLNEAALAKTYEAISQSTGGSNGDEQLAKLVQSGNFVSLYTQFMLSQKEIIPTPERTEDVHGEWVEYLPGQEKQLSIAAEGTPWCVASPTVGKNYLEGGEYDFTEGVEDSQAKFILFHLQNPETNRLSSNACASIRLGIDGRVAEISGLGHGQALEDSLVPIVEAKVKTLPGGDIYLQAFEDKRRLIALDKKLKEGGDFSEEDLRFVFEADRPIKTLDTYHDIDPRVGDIRLSQLEQAKKLGIEIGDKVKELLNSPEIINANFDIFLELYNPSEYVVAFSKSIFGNNAIENLQKLLAKGVDIHKTMSFLPPETVAEHLEELSSLGATNEELCNRLLCDSAEDLDAAITKLKEKGMSLEEIVANMSTAGIEEHLDHLLSLGLAPESLAKGVGQFRQPQKNLETLDKLISSGGDLNAILSNVISERTNGRIIDDLLGRGADPNLFGALVKEWDQVSKLIECGADINQLTKNIPEPIVYELFDQLMDAGASRDLLKSKMSRADYLRASITHGLRRVRLGGNTY